LEANLFFDRLLEQARALPDVMGATLTSRPPLLWTDQSGRLQIEGRPVTATGPMCCVSSIVDVGDDFFTAMGLPLIRGRYLESTDNLPDAAGVVVVDEAFANRWFVGEDPLGKRVRAGSESSPWLTIVGVVGSVTYDGPGELWPTLYMAHNLTATYAPFMSRSSYLVVRTGGDPAGALPGIREVARRLDPNLAIAGSYTMDAILDQAVARPRFIMSVLSVFALVALVLGAIGIYGVVSYGVALRAGEIGIRRALGAEEREVVSMILRQALIMTAAGLTLGIGGAVLASRVLEGFLHQVSPTDPLTYFAVAAGVLLVAVLASWIPARRASGVDPLEALKVE
jgi:putative ABC transport system permease protein